MSLNRYKELLEMGKQYGGGRRLDKTVLSALDEAMRNRAYRADLVIAATAKQGDEGLSLNIRYHTDLGHPSEEDLMAVVSETYQGYGIDWDSTLVDSEAGTIVLNLEPSVESIPLGSLQDIPPEFVAIGSGCFKRSADASGNVMEVWNLKKTDSGLALIRAMDDLEITADDETDELQAGMLVETPHGPGKILRFDDAGNAFVQVGSRTRLVAKDSVKEYNRSTDKTKLQEFYSQIYGPEFAKSLVDDYGRK